MAGLNNQVYFTEVYVIQAGSKLSLNETEWALNVLVCFLKQLRDCELGATLNRELKLRIREVEGLTVHKPVMRNDIKMAAKLIQVLDQKHGLWEDQDDQAGEEKKDAEKQVSSAFILWGLFSLEPLFRICYPHATKTYSFFLNKGQRLSSTVMHLKNVFCD